MTALLAIPFSNGMVLAADGRLTQDETVKSDTFRKVFALRPRGLPRSRLPALLHMMGRGSMEGDSAIRHGTFLTSIMRDSLASWKTSILKNSPHCCRPGLRNYAVQMRATNSSQPIEASRFSNS